MNRLKKEALRKHYEARKGLTVKQIAILDQQDQLNREIEELARTIHLERFPEEYDFMYDSIADATDRDKGINPMNQEYIEKVSRKRKELGVTPLSQSGLSVSNDTMLLCLKEAEKVIGRSES